MLYYIYIVVLLAMFIDASPINKLSDADLDEVSTRLSRLKTLLEKINDVTSDSDMIEPPKIKHDTDIQAARQSHNNENDVDIDAAHDNDDDDEQRLSMIKQFIQSLDDRDLNKLKGLKSISDGDILPRNTDDNTPDDKPGYIPAVVMKGKFVPSKDEIKYSVEKNLLTDIALAMHSGITIKDILKDLIGQNSESNLEISKDDGQWLDRK